MKKSLLFVSLLLALSACRKAPETDIVNKHIDFSEVHISDSFWSPRLERVATVTIPVCIDQTEVQTGRIRNFENAAKGEGRHSGIFFDDSDVYKALEAIAYSLINHPDSALEAKADEWIEKIAAAQQTDGYINTYYTLTGLDKRWTDMDKHEMYCAGHLIEAGIAYKKATGKTLLLEVGTRMAEHIMSLFNEQGRHWVPGHEEIELAMVKLYEATGERKYLDYAYWLLSQRGHGYGYGAESIKDSLNQWNAPYYQDAVPVKDLRSISGHAVRSMYLYCGMSDVAARIPNTGYEEALDSLWEDVTKRNMYVTGGIGVAYCTEGFAADYELPNKEAYCETCASVGMALWNSRMAERTGDAKYYDIVERSVYNAMLAGINLEGNRFFYVNPLASDGNHHRQAWFGCACCPSNICRFLASLGNYIYAANDTALYVNLYIGNESAFAVGSEQVDLAMMTRYPWDGRTDIRFRSDMHKILKLRLPDWCRQYSVYVNDQEVKTTLNNGYVSLRRQWHKGDQVIMYMEMPIEIVAADPRVKADEGRRAVQRGPIVYCVEQADNGTDVDSLYLTEDTRLTAMYDTSLLCGVMTIQTQAADTSLPPFTLIPYFAWDNRESGKMAVWLPYRQ
ncbi:MAG: glycoside hydrolase family 127 protein [Paludibacteraceae bacterium]|nr:glycoside hydrolase family 127 protein [Paludibacteraceae bacterium]